MSDEYGAFRSQPGDNFKAALRSLADELLQKEAEIQKLESELEIVKAQKRNLTEKVIPEITEGMDGKFDLGDGRELILKEEIRSSIAGEKREPAISWLDEHDYGHIVKRQVIVEFAKGDTERCEAFLKAVRSLEKDLGSLIVKTNFTVHHSTLNSWVKERLAEGVDLPTDIFGIYRQRVAKVKEL